MEWIHSSDTNVWIIVDGNHIHAGHEIAAATMNNLTQTAILHYELAAFFFFLEKQLTYKSKNGAYNRQNEIHDVSHIDYY